MLPHPPQMNVAVRAWPRHSHPKFHWLSPLGLAIGSVLREFQLHHIVDSDRADGLDQLLVSCPLRAQGTGWCPCVCPVSPTHLRNVTLRLLRSLKSSGTSLRIDNRQVLWTRQSLSKTVPTSMNMRRQVRSSTPKSQLPKDISGYPSPEAPQGYKPLFPEDHKAKPSLQSISELRRSRLLKIPATPLESPAAPQRFPRNPEFPRKMNSPRRSSQRRRRPSCSGAHCRCTGWLGVCCWAWETAPDGSLEELPSCWYAFPGAGSWLLTRRRRDPSGQHY